MRRRLVAAAALLTGCVELGVVGDGTSISMRWPHEGHLVDGARVPDRGDGFFTREIWRGRGNRWGTDELVDLLTGVSRRMAQRVRERLVIADLSIRGGGKVLAWHRSHQTGRDVDLLFYVRDRAGKAIENDAMREFDDRAIAKDGSGHTLDIPKMWLLVRELVTAPEAAVQTVFIYEPFSKMMLEHAKSKGEPDTVIARARTALRQPKLAPHHDHFHVRIYCSRADQTYGCKDFGSTELLEAHDAEVAARPDPSGGKTDLAALARVLRAHRGALRRLR